MVGLGNPGIEFVSSRHNAGAEVVAALAERHQGRLRSEKGLRAEVCEVRIGGRRILVAVPTTFMNESGQAVAPLVRRAGIEQVDDDGVGGSGSGSGGSGDGGGSSSGGSGSGSGWAERLIVVHDDRMRLNPGEQPETKTVRFRSLGCYPLTSAVESTATTIADIVAYLKSL